MRKNYFFFRPVLYLPNKEFSVAVRFSPVKYDLRPVLREGITEADSNHLAPWEKYQVKIFVRQILKRRPWSKSLAYSLLELFVEVSHACIITRIELNTAPFIVCLFF